ncbi:unnamed protein product [Pieris macdunnoughi]|uniref:Uncharacterized protein n=1 Tax=Pieris macdunnoughi TaxID=345717 RepID=A0A821W619_9NEOP|nr:unnamed protein product [Pieris macdunnoughi]
MSVMDTVHDLLWDSGDKYQSDLVLCILNFQNTNRYSAAFLRVRIHGISVEGKNHACGVDGLCDCGRGAVSVTGQDTLHQTDAQLPVIKRHVENKISQKFYWYNRVYCPAPR